MKNMPLNESYIEIHKLDLILASLKQSYTLERLYDGWIIRIGNTDAIEHSFSLGSQEDLLETWGKNDVIGYLTAMQVIELWKRQGIIKI